MLSVILVCVFDIVKDLKADSDALIIHTLGVLNNPALLSVLGTRLLLNMKEAGAKALNEGTSCGAGSTISNIEFSTSPEVAASRSLDETREVGITEIEEIC